MGGKADLPPLHFQRGTVGRGLGIPSDTTTPTPAPSAASLSVWPAPTVQGIEVFEDAWKEHISVQINLADAFIQLIQYGSQSDAETNESMQSILSDYKLKCCTALRGHSQKIHIIKITERTVPSLFQLTHEMSDVLQARTQRVP